MAQTTGAPFDLRYPDEPDIADVPVDMKNLAEDVAREFGKVMTAFGGAATDAALTAVKGAGWTTAMTVKSIYDAVNAVKGAGWTTAMTAKALWDKVTALENLRPRNGGGTVYTRPMRMGTTTGNTDANGNIVITHGLGATPVVAIAQVRSPSGLNYVTMIKGRSSTTITADIAKLSDSSAVASSSVTVDWFVAG